MSVLAKKDKRIGCFIINGMNDGCGSNDLLSSYMEEQGCITYCCTPVTCCSSWDGMNSNIYFEWLILAEKELVRFMNDCFAIVIIGYSIGGLIGIHLAEKYNVDALITINTPIYISDFRRLVGMLRYQPREINPSNINRRVISALYNLFNFNRLVNQAKRKLCKLYCPLLVIQSKKDRIIDWSSGYYILENARSRNKEIQFFPKSGHFILCDSEKQLVFIRVLQFVEKTMESKLLVEGHI